MSKKLKKLLEKLKIEHVDEVLAKINADDDSDEIIESPCSGVVFFLLIYNFYFIVLFDLHLC